jgi:hydrogenase maturation protease
MKLADSPPGCLLESMPCPILILGVGNTLLRDEGVGVRVVQTMAQQGSIAGVEFYDGGTAGLDLLDVLAGRRKVIVVDAIASGSKPGTVLRFGPEELPVWLGPSQHDLGLLETLAIAKQLGSAPQEVVVFGITPKEVDFGMDLSPEIAKLVPEIIGQIRAELERTELLET